MIYKNQISLNIDKPGTVYLNAMENKFNKCIDKVYLLKPYINIFVDENKIGSDNQDSVNGKFIKMFIYDESIQIDKILYKIIELNCYDNKYKL